MTNRKHGSAARPRGLFSASDAAKLLARNPGEPTGVTVTLAGVTFDLKPMTAENALKTFELFSAFEKTQGKVASGDVNAGDILSFVGNNGPAFVEISRSILTDADKYVDGELTEFEDFGAFFDRLPMKTTLQTLLPAIMQAEGFGNMAEATQSDPRPPGAAKTTTR